MYSRVIKRHKQIVDYLEKVGDWIDRSELAEIMNVDIRVIHRDMNLMFRSEKRLVFDNGKVKLMQPSN